MRGGYNGQMYYNSKINSVTVLFFFHLQKEGQLHTWYINESLWKDMDL